jgi:hypothetical protein
MQDDFWCHPSERPHLLLPRHQFVTLLLNDHGARHQFNREALWRAYNTIVATEVIQQIVVLTMNMSGARIFARVTQGNEPETVAIVHKRAIDLGKTWAYQVGAVRKVLCQEVCYALRIKDHVSLQTFETKASWSLVL